MSPRDDWPPRLTRAMQNPSSLRESWTKRLAGVLISGYLWVAFTDSIATTSLAVGGLFPATSGAVLGGVLAMALLFLGPGLQALRTRQPMMVVATSSFGVRGSALVPGLLLGLVQIVWFAVAVHYAVEFNLRGLLSAGLINPTDLRPSPVDVEITNSTVYAATAMLWAVAAALVSTRFIRWIAALMVVYPVFIAISLAGAMLWSVPGLPTYQQAAADPTVAGSFAEGPAFWSIVQFVFGFSAIVAAQSVNWGATLRDSGDVTKAGAVGVGMASAVLATIALLTVAGSIGRDAREEIARSEGVPDAIPLDDPDAAEEIRAPIRLPDRADAYTIGTVFERRIGGIPGGMALIVLGLGSLASAVYAAFSYSNRLETIRKRPRRWAWGVVGAFVAYPLMVTGLAGNVPLVIDLTSGLVTPMLGVLTADYLTTRRGGWPGPRSGYGTAALLAWGLGSVVGLVPVAARLVTLPEEARWLPMALVGYLVALAISGVSAAMDPNRRHRPSGSTS